MFCDGISQNITIFMLYHEMKTNELPEREITQCNGK